MTDRIAGHDIAEPDMDRQKMLKVTLLVMLLGMLLRISCSKYTLLRVDVNAEFESSSDLFKHYDDKPWSAYNTLRCMVRCCVEEQTNTHCVLYDT